MENETRTIDGITYILSNVDPFSNYSGTEVDSCDKEIYQIGYGMPDHVYVNSSEEGTKVLNTSDYLQITVSNAGYPKFEGIKITNNFSIEIYVIFYISDAVYQTCKLCDVRVTPLVSVDLQYNVISDVTFKDGTDGASTYFKGLIFKPQLEGIKNLENVSCDIKRELAVTLENNTLVDIKPFNVIYGHSSPFVKFTVTSNGEIISVSSQYTGTGGTLISHSHENNSHLVYLESVEGLSNDDFDQSLTNRYEKHYGYLNLKNDDAGVDDSVNIYIDYSNIIDENKSTVVEEDYYVINETINNPVHLFAESLESKTTDLIFYIENTEDTELPDPVAVVLPDLENNKLKIVGELIGNGRLCMMYKGIKVVFPGVIRVLPNYTIPNIQNRYEVYSGDVKNIFDWNYVSGKGYYNIKIAKPYAVRLKFDKSGYEPAEMSLGFDSSKNQKLYMNRK